MGLRRVMEELKALREVVLERAATLAGAPLEQVLWEEARRLSLDELLKAAYLYGVTDAMDYLGRLLGDGVEA